MRAAREWGLETVATVASVANRAISEGYLRRKGLANRRNLRRYRKCTFLCDASCDAKATQRSNCKPLKTLSNNDGDGRDAKFPTLSETYA
jgi:hypothetical protein